MGPLKALPYLVMFALSNAGGWAGDALILRWHQPVAAARKAVNTIGGCVTCHQRLGVVCCAK
jgi:ACS family sodium-dependent inorganic phosphate cotransporter